MHRTQRIDCRRIMGDRLALAGARCRRLAALPAALVAAAVLLTACGDGNTSSGVGIQTSAANLQSSASGAPTNRSESASFSCDGDCRSQ
ncbi:MAG: hypothetical protein OEQ18_02945 [Gammaproteobacteria bacterium]|nr:hypothetical protein [Gammaproteobacteria bacterium]